MSNGAGHRSAACSAAADVTSPAVTLAQTPVDAFVWRRDLPGTPAEVNKALARAQHAGDIVRIRKGLYFKGTKTRYGSTHPNATAIALQILGHIGVGPTSVAAAQALGLTTQIPAEPAFAVAGPTPRSIPGLRICTRANTLRRTLNFQEIALLELLRGDWVYVVDDGWTALAAAAALAQAAGSVDLVKLGEVVTPEPSRAARTNFAKLMRSLDQRRYR